MLNKSHRKINHIIKQIQEFDSTHTGTKTRLLRGRIIGLISRFDQSVSAAISGKIKRTHEENVHTAKERTNYRKQGDIPKFMSEYYSNKEND